MARYIVPLYDLGKKLYQDIHEFNILVGQENVPDIGMQVYTEICSQVVYAIGNMPRNMNMPVAQMLMGELMCIPQWTTLIYTQTPKIQVPSQHPNLRKFSDIVRVFGMAFFKIIEDKIGFNPAYHYFCDSSDLDKMVILVTFDAAISDNPPTAE